MKQFLRKKDVAARYGIDQRTVTRWAKEAVIPPPIVRSRFLMWDAEALDKSDRDARKQRAPERQAKSA